MSFWNKKKVVVLNYDIKENKKKSSSKIYLLSVFFIIVLIAIWGLISLSTTDNFISHETKKILSKAGIYTKPVESVTVESNDKIGEWTLTKNAEWNDSSTATVTLKLESETIQNNINKDIIFIIDNSESMKGSRLDKIKDETINILPQLLENKSNRIALITFSDNSQVISDFTSDKDLLIEKINNIETSNNTNYYAGLKSIYDVLKNYSKDENKELITVFITDGKPNKSTPNEINIYKAIKEKYPYIKIYGIQYEMNLSKVIKELKNVTDEQLITSQSNFGEKLKETLAFTESYNEMLITNYINTKYFKVINEKDINSTLGNTKLEEENGIQKLIWNLNNKYATGSKQVLKFKVTLKDEYQDQAGLYPIIKSGNIEYKINKNKEKITDYETPVLNTKYNVTYDVNSPKECILNDIEPEEHLIYQNVNIKDEKLKCNNYIFKGWEIIDSDIKNINDNIFVMPGHDVTIKAIWSKTKLNLSMDGQVYQSSKIYKVLEDAANNKLYAAKYTGEHKDTFSELKNEKAIYYFSDDAKNNYTIKEKNNVLFANHCWQMIRTTDNGGVRLLYNGEPDENNQCGSDREKHVEIKNIVESTPISLDWYYGKSYVYDSANNKFKLDKEVNQYDINNYLNVIGKYTCALSSKDGTCQTLYYIQNISDLNNAKVVALSTSDKYNQIGMSTYNSETNSPAYIGYQYGETYKQSETTIVNKETITNEEIIIKSTSIKNKQYLYSDEIAYNVNQYALVSPSTSIKADDETLKGKYTMFKIDNQTDNKVYQIIGVDNTTAYYVELTNGMTSQNSIESIVVGDSVINTNGLYEIKNPQKLTVRDWFEKYNDYKNYYSCISSTNLCGNVRYIVDTSKGSATTINPDKKIAIAKQRDGLRLDDFKYVTYDQILTESKKLYDEGYKYTCNNISTSCGENELRLITSYSNEGYTYVNNYYYGANVTWDGMNYTLQNTVEMENYNNIKALDSHHYICLESGNKMCNKVAYIYGYKDDIIYYVLLENGVLNIDTAKENMFKKNINDSNAKRIVETWYEIYLKKYSEYIDDDAIYCNNRNELDNTNGWTDKNSSLKETLKYKGYDNNDSLNCQNITDQFSYKNEYAKLNYPIGLATSQELLLSKISEDKLTSNGYWTMTPFEFNNNAALMRVVDDDNNNDSIKTNTALSLRPVITLKENTEFDDGDGSTASPYHINVGEE